MFTGLNCELCIRVLSLKNNTSDLFKQEHWAVPEPDHAHSGQVFEERKLTLGPEWSQQQTNGWGRGVQYGLRLSSSVSWKSGSPLLI